MWLTIGSRPNILALTSSPQSGNRFRYNTASTATNDERRACNQQEVPVISLVSVRATPPPTVIDGYRFSPRPAAEKRERAGKHK